MSGKGDKRRPMQIERQQFDNNWDIIFQKNMIDKILINEVDKTVPDKEVALLLSGGVDSISVGFAAERLGKKIHAYSFRLDSEPSYDYSKAKDIAQMRDWKFTGIIIDTSKLINDFHALVDLGCKKKTQFECTYPFLHIYPEIEEEFVLSGWAADGYYGLSKKAMIHYKGDNFNEFRDDYFKEENRAGYIWHNKVAKLFYKKLITPYLSESVKEFFYKHNHKQLNRPFQKHHVRNGFYEFNEIGKVENHLNLQIGSGVNKLFETLLNNKEINFKNRTRMLDVYRDNHVRYQNNESTLDEFLL
jgi:asparagine synthetase B (glutamine-hydrolysing)|tara:strand:- start:3660 stop:4565 length:906 start_codon:yes stop_codon:yes gene_type:complete